MLNLSKCLTSRRKVSCVFLSKCYWLPYPCMHPIFCEFITMSHTMSYISQNCSNLILSICLQIGSRFENSSYKLLAFNPPTLLRELFATYEINFLRIRNLRTSQTKKRNSVAELNNCCVSGWENNRREIPLTKKWTLNYEERCLLGCYALWLL
jgi:hypothetical protein